MAPVKRMLLTMNKKLAAIKHLTAHKMTHSHWQLARWMKVQFNFISKSGGNYLIIICSYLNYLKTQQLFDHYLIII